MAKISTSSTVLTPGSANAVDLRGISGLSEFIKFRLGGVWPDNWPIPISGFYLQRQELWLGGGGNPAPTVYNVNTSESRKLACWDSAIPADDSIFYLGDWLFNIFNATATTTVSFTHRFIYKKDDLSRVSGPSIVTYSAGTQLGNWGGILAPVPVSLVSLLTLGTTANHRMTISFTGFRLTHA